MNTILSYKENTTHGDRFFPVEYYYCTIPETYRDLPMHWHEEMEIAIIQQGNVTYDINFETHTFSQGDILLIAPHVLHSASQIQNNTMASHSILFHLDLLGAQQPDNCTLKYILPILNSSYKLPSHITKQEPSYSQLYEKITKLIHLLKEKPIGFELLIKEFLYSFIFLLYENNYIKKEKSSTLNNYAEEKLKIIISYIQEHYTSQLTIAELAKLCHFSDVHFMNFFKKYTGMTCISYINAYRLELAAVKLENSSSSITTIAMDCGFHNVSYFNRLFKEKYNFTPNEYRKQRLET